jgi:hypothetical protein
MARERTGHINQTGTDRAEGEKVSLRERVIAMKRRRHRLSMRDRLRYRCRLVERLKVKKWATDDATEQA